MAPTVFYPCLMFGVDIVLEFPERRQIFDVLKSSEDIRSRWLMLQNPADSLEIRGKYYRIHIFYSLHLIQSIDLSSTSNY